MVTPTELWDRAVALVQAYLLQPAGLSLDGAIEALTRVPAFLLILALFYVGAKALVWVLGRTFLSPRRVDPMLGQLASRLLLVTLLFVGFAVALFAFGVNIFSLAITLGLVGAALALGLQNTVANIMGGISLVNDRPFRVGDRVKIGDFWGDVEEIGLRSTRILTTRREYVVVPNRLMDEREIWNYTQRYPEIRLDIPVSISYDSDRELARSLMVETARQHAKVLAFPQPDVVTRALGESGIEMELRAFVGDARGRYNIESDLLEGIQDRFQEAGIEIPFPYRTLVRKSELPAPAHAQDRQRHGPRLGPRRLLVATAGTTPALRKARTIVELARDLGTDLVLSYIVPRAGLVTQREGERAAEIFYTAAKRAGVRVKLVIREGDVVESIAGVVQEENCGGVVIGAPRSPVLMAWKSANVEQRLRQVLDVPVVVVGPELEVDPDEVDRTRRSLDRIAPAEDGDPAPGGPAS